MTEIVNSVQHQVKSQQTPNYNAMPGYTHYQKIENRSCISFTCYTPRDILTNNYDTETFYEMNPGQYSRRVFFLHAAYV